MKQKPRINRAIGYVRVSTGQQAESGLGIEAQRHAIHEAARRHRLELAAVHVDSGTSGSLGLEDRPGLADAVSSLHRGDTLLVAKRDRIARDTFVSVVIERELQRKGARLLSAAGEGTESDDPAAVFTRRILDAVSELERSLIAARTRAALKAKRARGERAGNVPYGFKVNGDGQTLYVDDDEQRTLALIAECSEAGYSLREIADELNRTGIRTRTGSEWRHQYVASLLRTTERHS